MEVSFGGKRKMGKNLWVPSLKLNLLLLLRLEALLINLAARFIRAILKFQKCLTRLQMEKCGC